mgnify:CR=1 FL=1
MELKFAVEYFTHIGADEITAPMEAARIPDQAKYRILDGIKMLILRDYPAEVEGNGGSVQVWMPDFSVYVDDIGQFVMSFVVHVSDESYLDLVGYVLTVINDCIFDATSCDVVPRLAGPSCGYITRLLD